MPEKTKPYTLGKMMIQSEKSILQNEKRIYNKHQETNYDKSKRMRYMSKF